MSVSVITDTRGAGLAALGKRLHELAREKVFVGVPSGTAAEADGTPMTLVAARTEFGDPSTGQPERPFLRDGIRTALPELKRLSATAAHAVANDQMPPETALNLIGTAAAGRVKQYMAGPHFAPNAPATIAKKGSEQPTVDSGSLRQSITHVVGVES